MDREHGHRPRRPRARGGQKVSLSVGILGGNVLVVHLYCCDAVVFCGGYCRVVGLVMVVSVLLLMLFVVYLVSVIAYGRLVVVLYWVVSFYCCGRY